MAAAPRIYVAEQLGTEPFNRGWALNAAFLQAEKETAYVVLHDVVAVAVVVVVQDAVDVVAPDPACDHVVVAADVLSAPWPMALMMTRMILTMTRVTILA